MRATSPRLFNGPVAGTVAATADIPGSTAATQYLRKINYWTSLLPRPFFFKVLRTFVVIVDSCHMPYHLHLVPYY